MRVGRMFAVAAVAVGLMVGALAAPAMASTGSQARASGPSANVTGVALRIINLGSQQCVDVKDRSRSNQAKVHQWTCNGQDNQYWIMEPLAFAPGFVQIRNLRSSKCMDLAANSEEEVVSGTMVQQFDCRPDLYTSERWQVRSSPVAGYVTIVNWVKGLCLELNGGGIGNGTSIQVWDCRPSGTARQLWNQR